MRLGQAAVPEVLRPGETSPPATDEYVYQAGGFTQDAATACPAGYHDGGLTPSGARACYPNPEIATPASPATAPATSSSAMPLLLLVLVAVAIVLASVQPAEG
jgi:hypothetical protein